MKKFLGLFLFLILYQSNVYACALCSATLPNIHVSADVIADTNSTTFNFKWKFEPKFTHEIISVYDKNGGKKLELSELSDVKINLENYIQDNSYLTFIKLAQKGEDINKTKPLKFHVGKPI